MLSFIYYPPCIQIINKVLSVGSAGGGTATATQSQKPKKERWVQFGAASSARLSPQDISPRDRGYTREAIGILLEQYLALPVDHYSLLDPQWVRREGEDSFRVSIPLKDMLGVDVCPEVSIQAHPDPLRGQVTLVGSRTALGSPALDAMFRLNLVAVLRSKRERRRRGLPDHLPGRPVQRLRQLAQRGRQIMMSTTSSSSSQGKEQQVRQSIEVEKVEEEVVVVVVPATAEAPFPSQKVYVSRGSMGDAVVAGSGGSSVDVDADADEVVYTAASEDEGDDALLLIDSDAYTMPSSASSDNDLDRSDDVIQQPQQQPEQSTLPLLECQVQVTMAIRVPGPLKVVPNPLLGYAGSVLARTVLNAVLPNFLTLLSLDFKDWALLLEEEEGENRDNGREAMGTTVNQSSRRQRSRGMPVADTTTTSTTTTTTTGAGLFDTIVP